MLDYEALDRLRIKQEENDRLRKELAELKETITEIKEEFKTRYPDRYPEFLVYLIFI